MSDPMTSTPGDDPAKLVADRALQALLREYQDDDQVPRLVVVVETPPDGDVYVVSFEKGGVMIGIASTADDEVDTHRLLTMGAASVRNAMSGPTKRQARQLWKLMRAGFEGRN